MKLKSSLRLTIFACSIAALKPTTYWTIDSVFSLINLDFNFPISKSAYSISSRASLFAFWSLSISLFRKVSYSEQSFFSLSNSTLSCSNFSFSASKFYNSVLSCSKSFDKTNLSFSSCFFSCCSSLTLSLVATSIAVNLLASTRMPLQQLMIPTIDSFSRLASK